MIEGSHPSGMGLGKGDVSLEEEEELYSSKIASIGPYAISSPINLWLWAIPANIRAHMSKTAQTQAALYSSPSGH